MDPATAGVTEVPQIPSYLSLPRISENYIPTLGLTRSSFQMSSSGPGTKGLPVNTGELG